MKKLILVLCSICLLVPTMSKADQPCLPCLASLLQEEILTEEEGQSIMLGNITEEELSILLADNEEIIPSQDYGTYVCLYLAYEALTNFITCLRYGGYVSGCCETALVYWLLYGYLCL